MSANLRQLSASCPLTVREFVNISVPRSGTYAMTTYIFLLCIARFLALEAGGGGPWKQIFCRVPVGGKPAIFLPGSCKRNAGKFSAEFL